MAEPLAKKARVSGYYKMIDGEKYCRSLLEFAEECLNDGQISYPEAKSLWDNALDGPGVTSIESATLKYSLGTHTYTDKASKFLQAKLKECDEVNSNDLDRNLLKKAEGFVKDGQISYAEAEELWKAASDGKPSSTQRKTLEYSLNTHKYTEKADTFLKDSLKSVAATYVRINDVRYDRELMNMVAEFASDGQVSFAEANNLWEVAQDGKGLSAVGKRTLVYTLESGTYKYTGKASKFLREKLGLDPKDGDVDDE